MNSFFTVLFCCLLFTVLFGLTAYLVMSFEDYIENYLKFSKIKNKPFSEMTSNEYQFYCEFKKLGA